MERKRIGDKEYIIGYHTQEYRFTDDPLDHPVKCIAKNAWLGIGYYFWTELEFAHYWGKDFKIAKTGAYDIYIGYLDTSSCINTVFDEEGYFFFKEKIEETIQHFKKLGLSITLERVNKFLADNIWPKLEVDGIIFDDKPTNPGKTPNRIYSAIPELYYRKRIQIVIFNKKNIHTFALLLENQDQKNA